MQVLVLLFEITPGIEKKNMLKSTRNKKEKYNKIVILARSKLHSTESKTSETLINNENGREDFTNIINEEKNYQELKESIGMMKSQRSGTEKNNLTEESKRKGID